MRTSTYASTAYDPCVPCLEKSRWREVRCTLPVHAYFVQVSSHSRSIYVWRRFFHHLALSLTLTPITTNYWGTWWYVLTILSTPQPLHPFPEHVCRRQPARMWSSLYIYYYSICHLTMCSAYTNHTIHIYTKRVTIRVQWLKTWMILSVILEY